MFYDDSPSYLKEAYYIILLQVHIGTGNLVFNIGCLDYVENMWGSPSIKYGIIGVSIGVFLIIIIVVIICLCHKKRTPSTGPSDQRVTNMKEDNNYDTIVEEDNHYSSTEGGHVYSSVEESPRYTAMHGEPDAHHAAARNFTSTTTENTYHYGNVHSGRGHVYSVPTEMTESHSHYVHPSRDRFQQEGGSSYTQLGRAHKIHHRDRNYSNFQTHKLYSERYKH